MNLHIRARSVVALSHGLVRHIEFTSFTPFVQDELLFLLCRRGRKGLR